MRKIMILCAGLLFSSGLLAAQTPDKSWTLDDCIRYGLENNITVKQYELAKENQEITVETTRFWSSGISCHILSKAASFPWLRITYPRYYWKIYRIKSWVSTPPAP